MCVCVREREREITCGRMCVRLQCAGSRGPQVNIRSKYKSDVMLPELCTVSFLCNAEELDARCTKSEQSITLHFTAVIS